MALREVFKEASVQQRELFDATAEQMYGAQVGVSCTLGRCSSPASTAAPQADTSHKRRRLVSAGRLLSATANIQSPAETPQIGPAEALHRGRTTGRARTKKTVVVSDTDEDSQSDASDFEVDTSNSNSESPSGENELSEEDAVPEKGSKPAKQLKQNKSKEKAGKEQNKSPNLKGKMKAKSTVAAKARSGKQGQTSTPMLCRAATEDSPESGTKDSKARRSNEASCRATAANILQPKATSCRPAQKRSEAHASQEAPVLQPCTAQKTSFTHKDPAVLHIPQHHETNKQPLQGVATGPETSSKVLTPGGFKLPAGPAYRVPGLRRCMSKKPLHTPRPPGST